MPSSDFFSFVIFLRRNLIDFFCVFVLDPSKDWFAISAAFAAGKAPPEGKRHRFVAMFFYVF